MEQTSEQAEPSKAVDKQISEKWAQQSEMQDLATEATRKAADPDLYRRRIELHERKQELQAEIKTIQSEAALLDERILAEWSQTGQQNTKVGQHTVYLRSDIQTSCKDTPALADVLGEMDLSHLRTANWQRFKSWLREQREAEQPIPEQIAELVEIVDVVNVAVRKA